MTLRNKKKVEQRGKSLNMRHIARDLGVSIASVSRALNNQQGVSEELRSRIQEYAMENAYNAVRPSFSQQGSTKGTQVLAFLLHRHEEGFTRDPFYPAILQGLEQEAAKAGYHVVVRSTTSLEEEQVLQLPIIRDRLAEACIIAGPDIDQQLITNLYRLRVPLLLVDNYLERLSIDSVEANNISGAYAATQHLIEHGYGDIVMVHGPLTWASIRDRVLGYQQAMWTTSFPPRMMKMEQTTMDDGMQAMQQVLAQGVLPRAILASNDVMALGVMHVARSAGLRVPEDLAIIGYDDIPAALLAVPSLSTVHIPMEQMGKEAAHRLLYLLQTRQEEVPDYSPVRTLIHNELVPRRSCGCSTL